MGMCVNSQGPTVRGEHNGKQSLIMDSNNCQITWYVMLAIDKSHCSIIHCKVSKSCNWNANQCKSILESSPAATQAAAPESESETETRTWMIHATHANIQMQILECQNAKSEMQKLSKNANFASAKTPLSEANNQIKINAPHTHTEIPNCNKAKSKHTTNNAACGFSHFRLTVANLIREFSTGAGCKSRKGGVASEKAINIFSCCWFCSGLPTYANYLVWFMPGIFSPSIGAVTLLLGLLGANWILQNAVDDACEGTFFTIKVAFNHFKSVNAIAQKVCKNTSQVN